MSAPLAIFLVFLIHTSGVIGISMGYEKSFLIFTPITILINCALLYLFHQGNTYKLAAYAALVIVIGFIIEAVGTNTGVIFGAYSYETALGPKILNTPVIIGFNWFMLSYAANILLQPIIKSNTLLILTTGVLLCMLDVIIEPIAIDYNFWHWEGHSIPIRNYIAWFLIAIIFALLQLGIVGRAKNKLAIWIFINQILFFGGLLLL